MSSAHVFAVGGPPTFRPQVARALGTAAEAVDWALTVTAAESAVIDSREPFDLIVLSPVIKDADVIGMSQFVARRSPTTAVVVVREHATDGSLPLLVRAGVRDVVDLSRGGQDLHEALQRALEWATSLRSNNGHGARERDERRGRIISIFSTKGGTGKTFLACNLSAAIAARSGRPTALLDLDLELGDVFAYFGREPMRPLKDLVAVGEGADGQGVPELGTPLGNNLTGFGSPPDPTAKPVVGEAMGEVLRALRESFAYTVVDATSDYSDHVIAAFDLSDAVCLVTTLDVIGARHLSLGMQTLDNLGVARERLRIVLNRANSKVDLRREDIERALGVQVDARIPSSVLVPRSINRARLVWREEPRSAVSKSITAFADSLLSQLSAPSAPALTGGLRGVQGR